jgi:hypothetical protein
MGARRLALFVAAVASIVVGACHREPLGVTEKQAEPPEATWATLRPDASGWTVHAVNRHEPETHVDGIDMGAIPDVATSDGQLLVHGGLRGSVFVVDAAYRALSSTVPMPDEVFVQLGEGVPSVLNVAVTVTVPRVDLSRAEPPGIDRAWLENRVHERGAVLAGHFVGEPGDRGILRFEATQVYVPLPDRAASCARRVTHCPRGKVPAYERDTDRCLVFRRCVVPSGCPAAPPSCDPGFALRSWPSPPYACRSYACDPAFLPE